MRQELNPKKVAHLREQTGLPVVHAQVRGGTGHRIDLLLEDRSIIYLYSDGTTEVSDVTWDPQDWESTGS